MMACNLGNLQDILSSQKRDVGTTPKCVGAYPGLYDLIGNVSEWLEGMFNMNVIAGEDYQWTQLAQNCKLTVNAVPQSMAPWCVNGIRCCL
jgi:hypothetical protein